MAARRYPATEAGNAELFVAAYNGKVKYDHAQRKWYLWKGHTWGQDKVGEVMDYALTVVRKRYEAAKKIEDEKKRVAEMQWCRNSESLSKLKSILEIAKSKDGIRMHGDEWNTDPYLLGCANGVVDLRTGKMLKADPSHLVTMSTGLKFDPKATCPVWEKFLEDVIPDAEVRAYIAKSVGYSITGDTREQILTCIFGSGGNGKSVFTDTLVLMMGDYGHAMAFSTIEFKERSQMSNDIAALIGKRLVIASETQENVRLNEGRIKSLTGRDRITCRFLYQENFSYYPTAKYFLASNHKPVVHDDSEGFWRRLKMLMMDVAFTDTGANGTKKRDKELPEKLIKELSGILAWSVRQCLVWQQEGLHEPDTMKAEAAEYREESNPIKDFIDEECVRHENALIAKKDLYKAYVSYCKSTLERFILGKKTFGQRVKSMGFGEKKLKEWCWTGVGVEGHEIDANDLNIQVDTVH